MEIGEYLAGLRGALEALPVEPIRQAAARLEEARRKGHWIFVIGNGGSAATASHFVNDLNKLASDGKEPRFRAIALADNVPWLTALANDTEYGAVFVYPLQNLARADDVLVSITTSGESENVYRAMLEARCRRMTNVLVVGRTNSRCGDHALIELVAAAPHQTMQEDLAMAVCHALAEALR